MITISETFLGFKDFFKNLLTVYQRENDTYIDSNNEGLFERYMALFGESLDNEQASQIDNYLDIIDASICEEKFLTHISDVLGNPPDVFLDTDQYRNLLLYITNVYKVKGTTRGYLLFFYILGFDVSIEEIEPQVDPLKYDNAEIYDTDEYDSEQITFDRETCQACSYYNIRIKRIDQDNYDLDSTLLIKMNDAIKFNEPINARLGKFILVLVIEDEIIINTLTDEGVVTSIDYHYVYDSPLIYDLETPEIPEYDDDIEED